MDLTNSSKQKTLNIKKNKPDRDLKFVCISDTHSKTDDLILPEGDVLIHSGDFSNYGGKDCLQKFKEFFDKQKFQYKIIVAGNHDWTLSNLERERNEKTWKRYLKGGIPSIEEAKSFLKDFIYLEDSGTDICGLKIWGSPMSIWFAGLKDWGFTVKEEDICKYWDLIPENTDILITHSPPGGILDTEKEDPNFGWGSPNLLKQIEERIDPSIHVFGHVHDPNGFKFDDVKNIAYVNAAICDNNYDPINKFKVFTITKEGNITFELD